MAKNYSPKRERRKVEKTHKTPHFGTKYEFSCKSINIKHVWNDLEKKIGGYLKLLWSSQKGVYYMKKQHKLLKRGRAAQKGQRTRIVYIHQCKLLFVNFAGSAHFS